MDFTAQGLNTRSSRILRWMPQLTLFDNPERVLVLKLDILLLVWAFVAGLTKDMDQSATTQAYVSGMKESLSLYGNELVEFTTYFSIGYALAIVPAQMIQTLMRPSIFLPACEVIWGILTVATYASKNAQTVYAIRFFLGIFESTSWPGLVSLIFNWYTPGELGKRLAIFGVSSAAGNMFLGILQAALYKNLNGVAGKEGWQWLFIVSGCITVFWGLLGFLIIPDSPTITRAPWLTHAERRLAVTRMERNNTETSRLINYKRLLRKAKLITCSPLAWLYMAAYLQFAWSQRANSYFLLYLKGLEKADGQSLYSTYTVNLIPLGGYAISIVSNVLLNAISDWKQWRVQISVAPAVLQIICCAVLSAWPDSTPTILTFYFLTFATAAWGYSLLAWLGEILRKEPEARSLLVGASVTLVYVGHATIPLRAWRTADSPRYPIGFPLATAFAGGSILAILGMYFYLQSHSSIVTEGLESSTASEGDEQNGDDLGKPGALHRVSEEIGGFPAIDFSSDGSFFILQTMGRTHDHLSALARTSEDTFIFLGDDIAHHPGVFRPSVQLPLPGNIYPSPLDDGLLGLQSSLVSACPRSIIEKIHPADRTNGENYRTTQLCKPNPMTNASQLDTEAAIEGLQILDGSAEIFVVIAHDSGLQLILLSFPSKITN
ncbi:major facilitator superfamily domain-containing protein [Aspergillus californicus]